ncbi:tetratricopeptide repeat protein [Thiohalospira sp.]|uniref:tetratricopeptide repeat protein n=1 Tax=Thiohalospira sp. TaxID=3080549 RepID=UPI00397F4C72
MPLALSSPLPLLLAALLTSGCAGLVSSDAEDGSEESAPPMAREAEVERDIAPSTPDSGLTEEVLYDLLVAEFAGQLHQLEIASAYYLRAAEATRDPAVAGQAAIVALFAGDEDRIREAVPLWVEVDPENLHARQTLAALLIRDGKEEQAVEQFETLLEQDGAELDFEAIRGLLDSREHRERALSVMGELVRRHPENAAIGYARARLANQLGARDEALEAVEGVLEERPDWTQALLLRAAIQRSRAGEAAAALPDLEEAVEENPDDRALRLTYARYLVDGGEVSEAREQFSKLAEENPDDPEVRFALGLLGLEQEDWEAAEEHFRYLSEEARGGQAPEAAYYLGMALEEQGRSEEALAAYRRVGQGQRAVDARIRAAWLMAEEGDLVAARHHLQAAEPREDSEVVQLRLAEGRLLVRHGHPEEAMEVYGDALERSPDHPEVLYGRAMAAAELERVERVEQDLKRLLEQDPDHAHALNALGYTLTDQTDRHEEAREYIQRALELEPEDPNILDSMGWVEYQLGNLEEAEKWLARAWEAAPGPEVAAHYGEVLWERGREEEARRIWEAGLEEDPDAEVLRETMHRYLE